MPGNIGFTTLLFIILVALLLFGPQKLPELGRALGRTLREFKKGAKDIMDDDDDSRPAGPDRTAAQNRPDPDVRQTGPAGAIGQSESPAQSGQSGTASGTIPERDGQGDRRLPE
jgi:sec-independent protein translocase protein TatA